MWILALVLFIGPTFLYWKTTWTEYGLRDDYSVTREAHEEDGKQVQFCGSQARPLEGWLLEKSFLYIDNVREMSWSRLGGSLTLGLMGAGSFLVLVMLHGWRMTTAACLGAMFAVVPSAQVIASWSILWPYELAAVLSMLGFVVAESGFRRGGGLVRQGLWCAAAACLVVSSVWIFQPNGLFYLVFVAVKVVRRGELLQKAPRTRILQHLLLLAASMLLAYVLIRLVFAAGWLPMSKRVAFEHDYLGKLVWYAKNSLPNALAVLVLNDLQGRTSPYFQMAAAFTSLLIVWGGVLVFRRRGFREGLLWFAGMLFFLLGAYGINLMVSERWASYRTIYPLVGVVLVYLAASVELLGESIAVIKRFRFVLGVGLVATAAVLARNQAYELIAVPQNLEWRLVQSEAAKLDLSKDQRVYVITPTPEMVPAALRYSDEFGSLSTDSDWVPKEMLKLLLREKLSEKSPCRSLDHMISGSEVPKAGAYDVVLDLRGLRNLQAAK
jgi:hypothetical protein